MAASSTAIANLALGHLGQARIELISEGSTESIWANEFYPHARDFVTEMNLWRYCKRTVSLTETTNDRENDFLYAYTIPSDCFKMHWILPLYGGFDPANPIRFECEGDVLYTDEYQARGVYCRQITDTTKFPPSIDAAMGWYLAHLLCQPLRQENRLLADTLNGFRSAIDHAIAVGAVEQVWIKTPDEEMAAFHRGR